MRCGGSSERRRRQSPRAILATTARQMCPAGQEVEDPRMKTRSTLPCRAPPNETAVRPSIPHFYVPGAYIVQMKDRPSTKLYCDFSAPSDVLGVNGRDRRPYLAALARLCSLTELRPGGAMLRQCTLAVFGARSPAHE